ncbi:MAG TPA: phage tail protein [Myxococcaceae bacterium]|nr:phage tail protein [Myxococcaceae bacterium]
MSDEGFGVLHTFRFDVEVEPLSLGGGSSPPDSITGSFSECTGLEGTMEQKVIKEGGHNYGAYMRAGQVTFATVILKRGISANGELFNWFNRVATGAYDERADVHITLRGPPSEEGVDDPRTVLTYTLINALPVKFKGADFNARGTEVGIEELHLVHEGMTLETET